MIPYLNTHLCSLHTRRAMQTKNAGRSSRTLPMLLAAAAAILLINLLADSRSAYAPQAEPARPRIARPHACRTSDRGLASTTVFSRGMSTPSAK